MKLRVDSMNGFEKSRSNKTQNYEDYDGDAQEQ